MHMMKRLAAAVMLSTAALAFAGGADAAGGEPGTHLLKMKKNSAVMQFDDREIRAAQPVTIRDSSAYLPLRGIAEPFGFALSYDVKTKEAVAKNAKTELRFKQGSATIKVNGKAVQGPGPVFVQHDHTMVPVRMWAELTGSRISASGTDIVIRWSTGPNAAFEVNPEIIYALQTPVNYIDRADHPDGTRIVEEQWEGRQQIFPEAGRYTITRRVRDAQGVWSEPYTVTVEVRPPNKAPAAEYTTPKSVYRIGERIDYLDRSVDDEDAIVRRTWYGKEDAFFEAGDKRITLEVEDKHGLTHRVTKTITILNEVLYDRRSYERLFTPVGGKYPVDSAAVLKDYAAAAYHTSFIPSQMVLSDSPETLRQTGIAYDTMLSGKTRFILYHDSKLTHPARIYLIATNPTDRPAEVGTGAAGAAGPVQDSMLAGKLSTVRYTEAVRQNRPVSYTVIQPNESAVLLPEMLSAVPVKPNQIFSAYADIESKGEIRYRVVVVPEGTDPLQALDGLPLMPRDGLHVRGTFRDADRNIEPFGELGRTKQRITLVDRTTDHYAEGVDDTTGLIESNRGNYGVWYRLNVRLAPRSLVTVNGRGGHYAGAFLVNGELVEVTSGSMLKDKNEAGVLYRTGARAETVEIQFIPASGSNLPIALLFEPLPDLRV